MAGIAAQLADTPSDGVLYVWIGLRLTGFVAPLGAVAGVAILWSSPIRSHDRLPLQPAQIPEQRL